MKKVSSAIVPIITIDRDAQLPLHRQVYDRYRAAILDGSLRPSQRVPSTRTLASELGVSRTPVVDAYAQLLAEGYFESRVGHGTVVSRSLTAQVRGSEASSSRCASPRLGRRPRALRARNLEPVQTGPRQRGHGAFCCGRVPFEHIPLKVWNRLITRHCRSTCATSLDYGDPMGSRNLREAIAVYLRTARGVRCDTDQIMIVCGSLHALEISTRALLEPGSRVWVEEPGYPFARNTLALHGCQIVPVPVDGQGLVVNVGIKKCRKAQAALVTPSHQMPLGVTMSATRRLQLLEWAENSGAWIIEDDYDSEYRYEGMPIASLQGLDRNFRVLYTGTFSKVLFPSLRLGYLVLPPDLIETFQEVRMAMDTFSPAFYQEVLADFIREGHFSRHIRRMRSLYAERRMTLIECLRQELGLTGEVSGAHAGTYLVLTLNGISERAITERAAGRGLWLLPLSPFYASKPSRQGLVLGYGSTPLEEIPKAVRKLREVLAGSVAGTRMNHPKRLP
ncbi:MAG: PLP-dependent aminotransferase family protein [Candidatus Sulfotelmatobacter sp.]